MKKLAEILAEVKGTRYLRVADYNRAVALTRFLEDLEAEYGDGFKVLKGAVYNLQCRCGAVSMGTKEAVEETETPAFRNWAGFIVNRTKYYIEINDNPFFTSYIAVKANDSKPHQQFNYKSERVFAYEQLGTGEDTLSVMFNYNGDENINLLKDDLMASFLKIKEDGYSSTKQLAETRSIYY